MCPLPSTIRMAPESPRSGRDCPFRGRRLCAILGILTYEGFDAGSTANRHPRAEAVLDYDETFLNYAF